MASSTLAKIFGWIQFGLNTTGQVVQNNGLPHGAFGWLSFLGSLAVAVGLHHAASTDGTK